MKHNAKEVGLFDANTHLSALVDRVERGEEIVITKRGTAVARLVPADGRPKRDLAGAVERIRKLRRGIRLGGISIRSLIDEGRV